MGILIIFVEKLRRLQSKENQESDHQTEKSHSLGQSKTENGVGEKLLLEAWVSRVSDDQRTEHSSNTGTRASNSDGCSTSSNKFGGGAHISSHWGGSNIPG